MNRALIVLFASFFLISCSNKKEKNMTPEKRVYTWNVQFAGYDFDMYDEKGAIDYNNFVTEFDNFPWIEQVKRYQKIQKGCSATLSVNESLNKTSLWVSIMGDTENNTFLIGYVYPKIKKGLFGFGKEKEIKWAEIFIVENNEQIKRCFKYYFSGEPKLMQSELRTMEKYDEMEVLN